MNIQDIAALVGIIGAFLGVLLWLGKLTWALAQMDTKVSTMWLFQMRRAMSEVVEKGIGEMNSPLTFNAEALARLDPIRADLLNLAAHFPKASDAEFLLKIEEVFGQRLLEIVCIPCRLSHGACLLLAFSVAKGAGAVELDLSSK